MSEQETINFDRIAQAIDYLQTHFKQQPSLEEVAEQVHLSPYHFQRMFKEWAGVSPKKFLQYISLGHARKLLKSNKLSLSETAHETGLSGSSRLHDLFVKIEGMTPAEYKNGGRQLTIHYSFAESPFGTILIASTPKGICHMAFVEEDREALGVLKGKFPEATFHQKLDMMQQNALFIFTQDWKNLDKIKLHLKGTDFQIKVWESLIKIPEGRLCTYGDIAKDIQKPKAARAVGTAIGDNPVAYLIPCHRVIQASGKFGQYRWGSERKTAMIGWEGLRADEKQTQLTP